jgi:OOP family OmpA-OmpF porin
LGFAFAAAVAAIGLEASSARAQSAPSTPNAVPATNGSGFDTHLFRPAMDSKGLFTVNGSDVLGAKEFSVGLILDYAHVLLRVPGDKLIEHSFQGTFQGNFGIGNQLVVGLDLPVDLMSAGAHDEPGWTDQKVDFQGVGYLGACRWAYRSATASVVRLRTRRPTLASSIGRWGSWKRDSEPSVNFESR